MCGRSVLIRSAAIEERLTIAPPPPLPHVRQSVLQPRKAGRRLNSICASVGFRHLLFAGGRGSAQVVHEDIEATKAAQRGLRLLPISKPRSSHPLRAWRLCCPPFNDAAGLRDRVRPVVDQQHLGSLTGEERGGRLPFAQPVPTEPAPVTAATFPSSLSCCYGWDPIVIGVQQRKLGMLRVFQPESASTISMTGALPSTPPRSVATACACAPAMSCGRR